jgi:hypothetical protein
MSHTPGPWHWTKARTLQHLQNDVHSCFAGVSMPNKSEYEADARLIAACPTMYDYIAKKAEGGDAEAQSIIANL